MRMRKPFTSGRCVILVDKTIEISKGGVMKRNFLAGLVTGLFLVVMAGMASATLTTIGTATYGSSNYNLIWDEDNNGNSVIWLDYSNSATDWSSQTSWAAGLGSSLTYNIDSAYTVDWGTGNDWRLGSTVNNDSSLGYDQTTSEMGHLFYDELNLDHFISGDSTTYITSTMLNATNFDNLIGEEYWSGTEYSETGAWYFKMDYGNQNASFKYADLNGLALRSGTVSADTPVPEPATMLLFGTGLLGLAGVSIRRRKK